MNDRIDLAKMKREFNDPDGRYIGVREQANVLSLIEAVEAAQAMARNRVPFASEDAWAREEYWDGLDATLARFDFGDAA